jgi:hypothetical protein
MIDATSEEWCGKESKQYALTAVVPAIMLKAIIAHATKITIQWRVCWKDWP